MRPRTAFRNPAFLVAVFAAVGVVIAASFLAYSLQPAHAPPANNVVFSNVALANGNASFMVENVSGGPFHDTGFQIALVVNEFTTKSVPLRPNISASITIGPNTYRVLWTDSNGDRAVDVGDSFSVSGDRGPLPALSYYEFDLRWEMQWTAKATWSTP